jgi:hypothetical protein
MAIGFISTTKRQTYDALPMGRTLSRNGHQEHAHQRGLVFNILLDEHATFDAS